MPEIPDVIPGAPVESGWGNEVRDRVISRYADATDRALSEPFPQTGQVTWVDVPAILEVFDGVDWVPLGGGGGAFLPLAGGTMLGAIDMDGNVLDNVSVLNGVLTNDIELRVSNLGSPAIILGDGSNDWLRIDGDDARITRPLRTIAQVITSNDGTRYESASGDPKGFVSTHPNLGAEILRFGAGADVADIHISMTGLDSTFGTPGDIDLREGGSSFARFSATEARLPPVFNDTTGSDADVVVESDGTLKRSTSARKYKSDIRSAPELADLSLDPVRFHHDGDDQDYIGIIADDIPDPASIVTVDGEVENYDLRAVVAILAAKVNRLEAVLNG